MGPYTAHHQKIAENRKTNPPAQAATAMFLITIEFISITPGLRPTRSPNCENTRDDDQDAQRHRLGVAVCAYDVHAV